MMCQEEIFAGLDGLAETLETVLAIIGIFPAAYTAEMPVPNVTT